MHIRNYEFKAKVAEVEPYEEKLLTLNPLFMGTDHQVDTYFEVPNGRLKLREGNIENALINYSRENTADSKLSEIILYKHDPSPALKEILALQFRVQSVVDKKRKIYFIDNIKFHFDTVEGLGNFIEVEAIDVTGKITVDELKRQCDHFRDFFELSNDSILPESYSDMIRKL